MLSLSPADLQIDVRRTVRSYGEPSATSASGRGDYETRDCLSPSPGLASPLYKVLEPLSPLLLSPLLLTHSLITTTRDFITILVSYLNSPFSLL